MATPPSLKLEVIDTQDFHSKFYHVRASLVRIGGGSEVECVIPRGSLLPEEFRVFLDSDVWYVRGPESSCRTSIAQADHDWKKLEGAVRVQLPVQLRIAEQFVVRISLHAEDPGLSPPVGSEVQSIGPQETQEAFLVLDMCDSSFLASRDEKMAYHLKRRMREIVQPLLRESGAQYTQSTGDGWLAAIPSPSAALTAAKKILLSLEARNRGSTNPPIRVRIGLHAGKAYIIDPQSHDRHGSDLNRTFRIEGVQQDTFEEFIGPLPKEDRILCSQAFLDCLAEERTGLVPGARSCGRARLKGFPDPVEILLIPW